MILEPYFSRWSLEDATLGLIPLWSRLQSVGACMMSSVAASRCAELHEPLSTNECLAVSFGDYPTLMHRLEISSYHAFVPPKRRSKCGVWTPQKERIVFSKQYINPTFENIF